MEQKVFVQLPPEIHCSDGVFAVELVSKVVGALVVEGFVSEGENFELSLFKN